MSFSTPKHESSTGPAWHLSAMFPRTLAMFPPLAYKLEAEVGNEGSDVVERCRR